MVSGFGTRLCTASRPHPECANSWLLYRGKQPGALMGNQLDGLRPLCQHKPLRGGGVGQSDKIASAGWKIKRPHQLHVSGRGVLSADVPLEWRAKALPEIVQLNSYGARPVSRSKSCAKLNPRCLSMIGQLR